MSWLCNFASECVSSLLEIVRRIVPQIARQAEPTPSGNGNDSLSEEFQQAIERLGVFSSLPRADGPDRKLYQCFYLLGRASRDRWSQEKSRKGLEESIRLLRTAVSLCSLSAPERGDLLFALAGVIHGRYNIVGSHYDLEECIHLYRRAMDLRPTGHPYRPGSLNNLAIALSDRYARLGNVEDLEEHIHLNQEALELRPEGNPDRFMSLNNLAVSLGNRYSRLGNVEDLEEQIYLHQQALGLCPAGTTYRSISLNNLADALGDRYARIGDIADLEERIRLRQEALNLLPEGHPDRSRSLNKLMHAFNDRYVRLGDVADLGRRINTIQETLALYPKWHPDRSTYLTSLAVAHSDRYMRLGDVIDIEECVRLNYEALALHPEGHPDRSMSLNNLAAALTARYTRLGNIADLDDRIRLHQKALDLRTEMHPERSGSLNNLANALSDRYARLRDNTDLESAISHLRSGSTDAFSSQAIALQCAFRWIDMAEEHDHRSLTEAFTTAMASVRQYLSIGPTAQIQYAALLQETRISSLPVDAAACFIETGNVEQGIELLDEGRALLISELRRYREMLSPVVQEKIGEHLSSRYLCLCEEIRKLSNTEVKFESSSASASLEIRSNGSAASSAVAYGKLMKEKREKKQGYNDLLTEIRALPGCDDFQRRPNFANLQTAAKEGPVVIINCSKRRSDIIIVFSHRPPLLIPLSEDFFQVMQDTSKCYLESSSQLSATEDIVTAISDILEPVAEQLWTDVVQQVVDTLQDNGIEKGSRIWWCPTSFLTSLPIHAAGSCSDWLIDHYVSSYTPTLSALISARQLAKEEPSSPRILVVAQTESSGLKHAKKEANRMSKLGSFVDIIDEQAATPASVVAKLPPYNWAHFICHGTVSENPFESSLLLYGESRLSLNDIFRAHLPDAQFAFLAACHSAGLNRGETVLQDEALHLAGAMQVSGFRSVVGTMWQMEDKDGPRLAEGFYKEMLAGNEEGGERHRRAARALWKATKWLKNEKKVSIARWANYIHIGA